MPEEPNQNRDWNGAQFQNVDSIGAGGNTLIDFDYTNDTISVENNAVMKLREVGAQPSASDLSEGEWAWTDDHNGLGTAAWLFKNANGTLHYFEPSGTK